MGNELLYLFLWLNHFYRPYSRVSVFKSRKYELESKYDREYQRTETVHTSHSLKAWARLETPKLRWRYEFLRVHIHTWAKISIFLRKIIYLLLQNQVLWDLQQDPYLSWHWPLFVQSLNDTETSYTDGDFQFSDWMSEEKCEFQKWIDKKLSQEKWFRLD